MSKGIGSKKDLITRLDRAFSKYIRERDEGICPICHRAEVQVCFHLFHRGKFRTRWDEINCFGTCWECNDRHERDEKPAVQYFVQRYSEAEYERLEARSNNPEPYSIQELEDLLKLYCR